MSVLVNMDICMPICICHQKYTIRNIIKFWPRTSLMQYPYMNVRVHIEDDIIELVDPDHSSTPARGYLRAPTFKIVGKHLGVTSLHVSSFLLDHYVIFLLGCYYCLLWKLDLWIEFTERFCNQVSVKQQSGNEILSQPIKVEIYAPPRLHPNHIFLVPGASYAVCLRNFLFSFIFLLDRCPGFKWKEIMSWKLWSLQFSICLIPSFSFIYLLT